MNGVDGSVFQPQEPVTLSRDLVDGTHTSFVVRSLMRSARLRSTCPVVIPFADETVEGRLILGGAQSAIPPQALRELVDFYRSQDAEIEALRHRDVDSAYQLIARASTSPLTSAQLVDLLLASGRRLMGSDVAYLSLPGLNDDFVFSRTLGVRTEQFRTLRVGPHQGLGGAVRDADSPVFVTNYQSDRRVGPGLRNITKQEGIYSALASPVHDGDDIAAVMYVASRSPLAYSSSDAHLLEELSQAVLLTLQHDEFDAHRRAVIREEERRRLALDLHDRLGRHLTRIAFATEDLHDQLPTSDLDLQLDGISAAVEECQALIRAQLDSLLDCDRPTHRPLRAVTEEIDRVPRLTGMRRSLVFRPPSLSHRLVTERLAESMVRVGQEAVFNAERHSDGRLCVITVGREDGDWVLTVEDDGCGIKPETHAPSGRGQQFMREAVSSVGGSVRLEAAAARGLIVRCTFPDPDGDHDGS